MKQTSPTKPTPDPSPIWPITSPPGKPALPEPFFSHARTYPHPTDPAAPHLPRHHRLHPHDQFPSSLCHFFLDFSSSIRINATSNSPMRPCTIKRPSLLYSSPQTPRNQSHQAAQIASSNHLCSDELLHR